jgi:ubiquinone/menaquinone biosynthesis C-methylase UbiE
MSRDTQIAPGGADAASFTGERFLPRCSGEIAYEHWHRYAFAGVLAPGKTVLDVACGEGYGAAMLSGVADEVHGVDIDAETIGQASRKYAHRRNLRFTQASCVALPFPDRSFDVIVSFETIEHIDGKAQIRMLGEFDRLLKADGVLMLSSPNRAEYSDGRVTHNEFHVRELYREELQALLARHFGATRWFGQRIQCWSGIWSEAPSTAPINASWIDDGSVDSYGSPQAMYFVVLAARAEAALAAPLPRGSILTDRDDSVAKRYETAVVQLIEHYKLVDELTIARDRQSEHVLHLEGVVHERDVAIARQGEHIQHLEQLVLERERAIERGALLIQEVQTAAGAERRAFAAAQEQFAAAQGQLAATQKQIEVQRLELNGLQAVNLEQQKTINHLEGRVRQLTETVHQMYRWRWWIRFPLRRFRKEPPPE